MPVADNVKKNIIFPTVPSEYSSKYESDLQIALQDLVSRVNTAFGGVDGQTISVDTTYTIGTGGDYASYNDALDYLKDKWINDDVAVTLTQISNLTGQSTVVMKHPCSKRITINFSGYTYRVDSGNAFHVQGPYFLYMTTTGTTTVISQGTNNTGYGILATDGAVVYISCDASNYITIGRSSYQFSIGIYVYRNSSIYAAYIHVTRSNATGVSIAISSQAWVRYIDISYSGSYGIYSETGSYINAQYAVAANNTGTAFYATLESGIYRNGASGAEATDCSPAVGAEGNYNSIIT